MSTGPTLPQTFGQWAITLIVVGGVIAILYVGSTQLGIPIPGWVIQIVWICVIVCVLLAAVKFVLGRQ